MTSLSSQILQLRSSGLTYSQITKTLNCSKSVISYYLNPKGKINKNIRQIKRRTKIHPFERKFENFITTKSLKNKIKPRSTIIKLLNAKIYQFIRDTMNKFSVDDVINKFGTNPKCYLTGEDIDIYQPSTYQFDHIIPRSRGGDSSIDNLQICISIANSAKSNMTPDELINLCKRILENNNFKVTNLSQSSA